MKTAIDGLIEQIKSKADSLPINTKENRRVKGIYVDCLIMAREAKEMEKQQLEEVDKLLHEIEMDEYLNEDTLPKVRKARGIIQRNI
jgi:hypothetical protein